MNTSAWGGVADEGGDGSETEKLMKRVWVTRMAGHWTLKDGCKGNDDMVRGTSRVAVRLDRVEREGGGMEEVEGVARDEGLGHPRLVVFVERGNGGPNKGGDMRG